MPLVALGLYGGAIVDAHDRRRVALAAGVVLWSRLAGHRGPGLARAAARFRCSTGSSPLQAAAFAVNNPARQRSCRCCVRRELLPAANALTMLPLASGSPSARSWPASWSAGSASGIAYTVDAITYLAALCGVWRLPAMPPPTAVRRRRTA